MVVAKCRRDLLKIRQPFVDMLVCFPKNGNLVEKFTEKGKD